jgi:uncharacterized protein
MDLGETMPDRVLIDTGPLVALLNSRDAANSACRAYSLSIVPPMLTTWLVIGEAAWLLRDTKRGIAGIFQLIAEGIISVEDLGPAAAPWIAAVLDQYSDLRPDLADVSQLYLAERTGILDVFTLDRRDFTVYRDRQGNPFRLHPRA